MPLNLENFSASLANNGFAKQNRFEVFFYFPPALGGVDIEMTLRAESATMPGRNILTIDDHRGAVGPIRKIGYNTSYENFSTTLVCNRFFDEKEKLERWLDLIVGDFRTRNGAVTSESFKVGYYRDYIGTIEVQQYDELGTPTYRVKLLEAYPVTISSLDNNWGSSDIHRLTATFAYRYYAYI